LKISILTTFQQFCFSDLKSLAYGRLQLDLILQRISFNFQQFCFFRPQILTFDEKRKRATLVVISAKKLSSDAERSNVERSNVEKTNIKKSNVEKNNVERPNIEKTNVVENKSDDVDGDEEGEVPLGDTVQRQTNGRGRVLCTRL
jgi:hypothetical protein